MEKKELQRNRAEGLVSMFRSNYLLETKNYSYRIQEASNYVLITGLFFSSTVLDIISSLARSCNFNFTGVGLNLYGRVEVQLDPQ